MQQSTNAAAVWSCSNYMLALPILAAIVMRLQAPGQGLPIWLARLMLPSYNSSWWDTHYRSPLNGHSCCYQLFNH
jgi:hypothetical protein